MHRAAHPACALLALATGCLPAVDPPWLVDDVTIATVTTRVVELGPLAPERGSVMRPAPMVDPLPGDAVELEAVVLDADGELIAEDSAPRWLLCGLDGACPPLPHDARPAACAPNVQTPPDRTCVLGDGALARLNVGELRVIPGFAGIYPRVDLMIAAGTPGSSSGGDCLDRLQTDAGVDAPLWDCRFGDLSIDLGPAYPLLVAAEAAGVTVDPPSSAIPVEARGEPPNRAPVVDEIAILRLDRGDEIVHTGEPVALDPGERVGLDVRVDPVSEQSYFGWAGSGEVLALDEYIESIYATWLTAEPLEDVSPSEGWPLLRTFRMPESGRVRHVVVIEDGRGARTWAVVDLEVAR